VDGLYQDENGYYGFDGEDAETFSAAMDMLAATMGQRCCSTSPTTVF